MPFERIIFIVSTLIFLAGQIYFVYRRNKTQNSLDSSIEDWDKSLKKYDKAAIALEKVTEHYQAILDRYKRRQHINNTNKVFNYGKKKQKEKQSH